VLAKLKPNVTPKNDRHGEANMLLVLMVCCAVGAVFLIGLGAFTEFRELWTHPDHRVLAGGSRRSDERREGLRR
jgi:uncharacterized membrane protein